MHYTYAAYIYICKQYTYFGMVHKGFSFGDLRSYYIIKSRQAILARLCYCIAVTCVLTLECKQANKKYASLVIYII
jgi:hypothetical protein